MELLLLYLFIILGMLLFSYMFKQLNIILFFLIGLLSVILSFGLFTGNIQIIDFYEETYNYNYSYTPPLLNSITYQPNYINNVYSNFLNWFTLLFGIYILSLAVFDLKGGINDREFKQ